MGGNLQGFLQFFALGSQLLEHLHYRLRNLCIIAVDQRIDVVHGKDSGISIIFGFHNDLANNFSHRFTVCLRGIVLLIFVQFFDEVFQTCVCCNRCLHCRACVFQSCEGCRVRLYLAGIGTRFNQGQCNVHGLVQRILDGSLCTIIIVLFKVLDYKRRIGHHVLRGTDLCTPVVGTGEELSTGYAADVIGFSILQVLNRQFRIFQIRECGARWLGGGNPRLRRYSQHGQQKGGQCR